MQNLSGTLEENTCWWKEWKVALVLTFSPCAVTSASSYQSSALEGSERVTSAAINSLGHCSVEGDARCFVTVGWEGLCFCLLRVFGSRSTGSASLGRARGEQLISIFNILKICSSPLLFYISSACKRIVFYSEDRPLVLFLSVFFCKYFRFVLSKTCACPAVADNMPVIVILNAASVV